MTSVGIEVKRGVEYQVFWLQPRDLGEQQHMVRQVIKKSEAENSVDGVRLNSIEALKSVSHNELK